MRLRVKCTFPPLWFKIHHKEQLQTALLSDDKGALEVCHDYWLVVSG
jgi:hypothetical protein